MIIHTVLVALYMSEVIVSIVPSGPSGDNRTCRFILRLTSTINVKIPQREQTALSL